MPEENKATSHYNMDELFSQNAYGVVELVDGTKVKCQFTMRFGLSAEKALAQLDEWTAFLEGATSRGVKFDGPNPLPRAPEAPQTGVNPVAASKEVHYEEIVPEGCGYFTVSAIFHDQTKNGKDVLKIVTIEPGPDPKKPYNGKYGVSCFHPNQPGFEGWQSWGKGARFSAPAGAGHVVIRHPAPGVSDYPDVVEFRP